MATRRKQPAAAAAADPIPELELIEHEFGEVPPLRAVPTNEGDTTPELVEDVPAKAPARKRSGSSSSRKPKKSTLGQSIGAMLGSLAGGALVLVSGRLAAPINGTAGAMTPEEAGSITAPLGRIAGRRAPKVILPGVPAEDQADVEEILTALLTWIARNAVLAAQRWGELQQARANASATPLTRRDNARPVDTPPPMVPNMPDLPESAPPAMPESPPAAASSNAPRSTMGLAEALIQRGYAQGDRGQALTGF